MRIAIGLCALAVATVVVAWAWLGAAIPMPSSPLAPGEKVYCVSYAPFRDGQTPLDRSTRVTPEQIADDLAQLKQTTDCVRTYSNDLGLDQVAGIARRFGLKVIQGLWLSSHPDLNRAQIETAVALAKRYPDVIRAIVVGNETLLRGELSAAQLSNIIRGVKAQVSVPVTYADVWEYWLRNRDLAAAVDFITIHILPYWEDVPIPAERAAAHVDRIRRRVAAAFPGKDVLIGEVGWPSRGRMREGALPSPANQARVLADVLALAKRDNVRVNLIEAFDQPWKRALEGTVGGHWGLYDAYTRQPKFIWGEAVSNHPQWRWQAGGAAMFVVLVFAAAMAAAGRTGIAVVPPRRWLAIVVIAAVGGLCVAAAAESLPLESLGVGGWTRSIALLATALGAPVAVAAALATGTAAPSFAAMLGRWDARPRDALAFAAGGLLIAAAVLALQIALGLAFDPRYRDFPDTALSAAIVPFLVASFVLPRAAGTRARTETTAATMLLLCGGYIVFNESFANWQSVWFCAALLALAVTLLRGRDARSLAPAASQPGR